LPGNLNPCTLARVDQPGSSYEAKYGLNGQHLRTVGILLVFCAAALLPGVPLWLRIVNIALFGGAAVMVAVVRLRGTTAVRVDQAGITLCAAPLYPKSTTRLFPWEDVASVVIWQGAFSGRSGRLECIGVERRPGTPPLTGKFIGRRAQSAAPLSPGIPPETAVTRAVASGWVLDHGRLTAAVAHFAPAVRVVDTTTSLRPGRHQIQNQK
jgi:hypothetical protein